MKTTLIFTGEYYKQTFLTDKLIKMKKPTIKDYCKPFLFDDKFVSFDSKGYAKAAEKYIEYLEDVIIKLKSKKQPK